MFLVLQQGFTCPKLSSTWSRKFPWPAKIFLVFTLFEPVPWLALPAVYKTLLPLPGEKSYVSTVCWKLFCLTGSAMRLCLWKFVRPFLYGLNVLHNLGSIPMDLSQWSAATFASCVTPQCDWSCGHTLPIFFCMSLLSEHMHKIKYWSPELPFNKMPCVFTLSRIPVFVLQYIRDHVG